MPETINEMEAAEAPASEEQGKSGKGMSRLLMILLMILLPAIGGAYLAYSQFSTIAEAAVGAGFDVGFKNEAKHEEEGEPTTYGQFVKINDLLINPAGTNGKRFLVVSLGLETRSDDVVGELEEKDIVIRDAILRRLGSYTDVQLASIEHRTRLKDELLADLNQVVQAGDIDRLYFTQFLLQ
jgi:flagellar FliL protein